MPSNPKFSGLHPAAIALLIPLGALVLWRSAYPVTPWAVVLWLAPAFVVAQGSYQRTRTFKRVWREAVWHPNSFVARWLTGRLAALWKAGIAVVVTLPVLAHLSLTGNATTLIALVVVALSAFGLSAVLGRGVQRQTAPALVLPVATRLAWWIAGAVGSGLVFTISLFWTPLPDYLDAAGWGETLALIRDQIPGHGGPVAWLMATLSTFEAMSYLLAREEARLVASPFLLIFQLVYDALAAFSFARLGADAAMHLRSGDNAVETG